MKILLPAIGRRIFALGLTNPLADELLHENVGEEVRTTVLSVRSMIQQIAAMVAALSLGVLAGSRGIPSAWIIVAVVVGVTAIFYLRVKIPDSRQELQAETALDTTGS